MCRIPRDYMLFAVTKSLTICVVCVYVYCAALFTVLLSTCVQASDMVSTSRILVAVVQMCYEAKDWDALNENIMLLSKRRSQLKQVRLPSWVTSNNGF